MKDNSIKAVIDVLRSNDFYGGGKNKRIIKAKQ
mgnify:CR=1 FL=1